MRTEVIDTKWGVDKYAIFTAQEIPGLIEKHGSHMKTSEWTGEADRATFIKRATLGDNGLVEVSEKFLKQIEDQIPVSRGWRTVEDVVGAVPNIPAFLAGHPQHMRRRQRVSKTSAPITIFMDLTSSGGIGAEKVTKRGTVLLALSRMLIEHRPVELWVGAALGRSKLSGTAAWRIDTAPLDLARSAYHIGASAMSRGFGYGLVQLLFQTGGAWPFSDYDKHCQTAKERLKPVFGFGDVLYIPPVYVDDELIDHPVEWLKKQLKQYVGEGAE